jgi:hypothetical protein
MLLFSREPNCFVFAFGAVLAVVGEFLRFWGAGHLAKNQELITSGPYAHLRHPLYVGTGLIMFGLLLPAVIPPDWAPDFKSPNPYVLIVSFLVYSLYYFPYKNANEAERMIRLFGDEAKHWVENVPEFLPRISRYERAKDRKWRFSQVVHNSEAFVPLAIITGFAVIARAWWLPFVMDKPPAWLMGNF